MKQKFPLAPPSMQVSVSDKRRPRSYAASTKLFNASSPNFCFAEDDDCSGAPIGSHAIQNSVILDELCVNNHLYILRMDKNGRIVFKKEGRNKAISFGGFCAFHDNSIFREIDLNPNQGEFVPTKKQMVLYHLRTLGMDLWTKSSRLKATMIIDKKESVLESILKYILSVLGPIKIKENIKKEKTVRRFLLAHIKGIQIAHLSVRRELESCLLQLKLKDYSPTCTHYLLFPHSSSIAASTTCSIILNLDGSPLYNPDRIRPFDSISLTIFPHKQSTHIVISYHKRYSKRLSPFIDQMLKATVEQQKIWISKLILSSFENVVFNPRFIEGMQLDDKIVIESWVNHIHEVEILPFPYIPNINLFS
jgi:hypothetical protein